VTLYHAKALLASIAVAAAGGIIGGLLYAWLGDRSVMYGIGTGLFVVSLICLGLGLLGATEPNEGWAAHRGVDGRRSLVARIATEHPDIDRVSSVELVVWGLVVGGGIMAASFVAYALAAR
jgi:MFS family permease